MGPPDSKKKAFSGVRGRYKDKSRNTNKETRKDI